MKRWGIALGFALAGVVGLVATLSLAAESPEYFVQGASPSREPGKTYYDDQGCVPYSASRPDIKICGDVSEGFNPGPKPGGASEYPEICQKAQEQYANEQARFGGTGIDPASCEVIPTSRYPDRTPGSIDFYVVFQSLSAGEEPVSVALDVPPELE